MNKLILFLVLGAAIILIDIYGLRVKRKKYGKTGHVINRKILRISFDLICVCIGLGSAYLFWNYTETTRLVGFPFPFAAFQLENGKWIDYVGIFSLPIFFLDFLLIYYFPHAIVHIYKINKAKKTTKITNSI